jgi:hypothetical protein
MSLPLCARPADPSAHGGTRRTDMVLGSKKRGAVMKVRHFAACDCRRRSMVNNQRFVASTLMLVTPYVVVAPRARSEMNR